MRELTAAADAALWPGYRGNASFVPVSETKRGAERLKGFRRFIAEKAWRDLCIRQPGGELDNVMDDALNTALQCLDYTGQSVRFKKAQLTAAMAILTGWKRG